MSTISERMNAATESGVPALLVMNPRAVSRFWVSGSSMNALISLLSRATIGAGVPAGATTASQPSMRKPGSVSATVGKSSNPGKRWADVMAIRRNLPERTNPSTGVTELIIAGSCRTTVSWITCAVDRYGTCTRSIPARVVSNWPMTAW